jgi:hypothetical protein
MIKEINGYTGYFISDDGKVYCNLGRGNRRIGKTVDLYEIRPRYTKTGYSRVCLRNDETGKREDRYIHRLVAEHFIPTEIGKKYVNHKNCIRSDNRVSNLEWCTPSENSQHAWRTGLCKLNKGCFQMGTKGELCINHKVVLQIKENKIIAKFYGTNEACRQTGICQGHIAECCRGERKTAGGYEWQYKDKKTD